ncbi:MAG: N-methyl-L-tryptophan oxidase [Candidatus Limnocylindria bacterium]
MSSITSSYDAIVAGLGAMGSAAAYQLARRGKRVLGLDAFARGHALGSSVGRTRVIRLAYFEHADYVPLLRRAWALWRELERDAGARLLVETGGLYLGPPGSATVEGSAASARQHHLAHERLDAGAIRRRFPFLTPPDDTAGLFEEQAGFLVPEACVDAHLRLAERHGAALRFEEPVRAWRIEGGEVAVRTERGEHRAGRLVLAAGAWLGGLLGEVGVTLAVERVPLFWFEPASAEAFALGRCPVYIAETGSDGSFYGFPYLADQGLKVARHGSGEAAEPDRLDRAPRAADEARVRRFLERYLPGANGPLRATTVCMYTKTPDEHFVIDRHPASADVVFASACSGHGFKFASVVGEILADLALEGRTSLPIAFLSLRRFAAPA